MADGGSALGSMQRLVEERTQQALTAQQALMQLQQDHARLSANLQTAQEQAASRFAPPPVTNAAPGACRPILYPGCKYVMHVGFPGCSQMVCV